jgi:UDP-N-acetyl-D-mannosaminuronic acid transferase (WecB/TagA/CpsF family)
MENTVKKTKAMYFAELREMVLAAVEDQAQQDELLEFIDKQIETLEKRKVAAAERAEKKKAESDAMTDAILAQIGDELITVDEIVVALDSEEVTRNKVTARLGKLVKAGTIVKEAVKVDGNKRMAYRLATDADAADANEE